ncbi:LOW QUALITY PROTEIN: hypothetical protein ACHAW5_005393 [Stephanodiscus triporus]|uniref:Uncharacterized protein n=1 Tax=Stephanodiscus triporus TaxID=2934178 RepID=A0ABD3P8I3_9STRA
MIEDCVRRLLSHDVDGELDGTIDRKIDLFWDELTHFQNRKYSRNHTQVFGPIASCATARITGSGGAERGWSDNKEPTFVELASRGDELEKPNCDTPDALWGDDDEQFDLGLEKWGVNIEELKKPLGPHRVFKCWVEDWENVMDKGDVMRTKFLVKYGGLVFDDIDVAPVLSSTKLKYIKRSGWHAMGEPPDYKGDGSDDEVLEPFAISEDVLIELIKTTEQPEILNVRLALNEEEVHDSDGSDNESISS